MVKSPTLKIVLENISSAQVEPNRECFPVGPLRLDSRMVQSEDTFVAVEGFQTDGRVYIPIALKQGASLIFAEENNNTEFKQMFDSLACEKIIWIANLRDNLSEIAANYFGHPSEELKNIAVTGTNGKTSCSYLIAKILQKLHFEWYLMGTLGVGCCGNLKESTNTTADAITLQAVLHEALLSGAQFSSMEISSHGLDQNRAAAVRLNTAIFTNLTRDHLDYHGNMESYGAAKKKLFMQKGLKNAVINMDDKFVRTLAKEESITATKWLVTTKQPPSGANLERWVWAEDISYSLRGIHANIYTPWGSGKLDSPLIGQFNLSNLLLVVTTLGAILKEVAPVLEALKRVMPAEGRMQTIGNSKTPTAIVDYAHTPDALEKALIAIREHCVGLVWCVFGCGGDRDSTKRSVMGAAANDFADQVIITNDNPRSESPSAIAEDIKQGIDREVEVILDRSTAIQTAIASAKVDDWVLIAGRGHEHIQHIGEEHILFSDREYVAKLLEVAA